MSSIQSHFLISAPSSNSGKTTITLALLRAFKKMGLVVQPFKCGPDYIDPIHHKLAAGRPSLNLDTFMSSEKEVQALYIRNAAQANVSVTEGVMGLFDGSDKMKGSSAEIAKALHVPVILVINAKSMAYSAAPLLYGFKNFDKRINVAGVIFNFVSTETHYHFLKEACADVGIEALGYFPQKSELTIPSRHLGLNISAETDYEEIIESLSETLPKTVDLDRLIEITKFDIRKTPATHNSKAQFKIADLKISIARDEAFSFRYHENIEMLSRFGQIQWFSPMKDEVLPETDVLYLPGGYPELYARQISENRSMLASIKAFCNNGGRTLAECGGLMYLSKSLTDQNGDKFPMAEVFHCSTTMQNAKMTLGYRTASWGQLQIKGHEFHYSTLVENQMIPENILITNAKGGATETRIYRKLNTYASYMHLYWADNEEFVRELLGINRSVEEGNFERQQINS